MELSISKETHDAIKQCRQDISDLKSAEQLLEVLKKDVQDGKVTVSADRTKVSVNVGKDEAEKTLMALMKGKVAEINGLMKKYGLKATDEEQKLLKKFA